MNKFQCDRLIAEALAKTFKEVMESGFLYLSKKVDFSAVAVYAEHGNEKQQAEWQKQLSELPWTPFFDDRAMNVMGRIVPQQGADISSLHSDGFKFKVPSLTTWCAHCGGKTHHEIKDDMRARHSMLLEQAGHSTFVFHFGCLQCKTASIVFLIHRVFLKLQLAGRSIPFFSQPPPEIPKELRQIYSDAIGATACKDFSAAFYHWRTLMEHQMKTTLGIALEKEMRSEDLTKEYNAQSHPFVRDKTALGPMLTVCSQHLHARTGEARELEIVRQTIEAHFKLIATINSIP